MICSNDRCGNNGIMVTTEMMEMMLYKDIVEVTGLIECFNRNNNEDVIVAAAVDAEYGTTKCDLVWGDGNRFTMPQKKSLTRIKENGMRINKIAFS